MSALIAAAPGSGFQVTFGDTLWFSLDATCLFQGRPI